MNFIIVEDELLISEMLKEMLKDLGHTVLAIAKNYDEFIQQIETNRQTECCFLDINLKQEKTGLDIARLLKDVYKIPFIFITSYSEKTIIDFASKFLPEGYIIKPFRENDLYVTIKLFQQRKPADHKQDREITIKDGTQYIRINISDIIWVKAVQVYVEIKTKSKVYLVRNSLSGFIQEVDSKTIVRVHRTFAVNITYVNAFSGNHIIVNGEKFPLSRTHKESFLERIK